MTVCTSYMRSATPSSAASGCTSDTAVAATYSSSATSRMTFALPSLTWTRSTIVFGRSIVFGTDTRTGPVAQAARYTGTPSTTSTCSTLSTLSTRTFSTPCTPAPSARHRRHHPYRRLAVVDLAHRAANSRDRRRPGGARDHVSHAPRRRLHGRDGRERRGRRGRGPRQRLRRHPVGHAHARHLRARSPAAPPRSARRLRLHRHDRLRDDRHRRRIDEAR